MLVSPFQARWLSSLAPGCLLSTRCSGDAVSEACRWGLMHVLATGLCGSVLARLRAHARFDTRGHALSGPLREVLANLEENMQLLWVLDLLLEEVIHQAHVVVAAIR